MIGSFSLYQLLVPLFSLFMIAKAISRFLRTEQTGRELFIWLLIWSSISLVALFPNSTVILFAQITGVKSGINALIFFGLVLLVYGYLQLFIMFENHEKHLTELVRKIALQQLQEHENRHHRR
jgi:hypothetical protein